VGKSLSVTCVWDFSSDSDSENIPTNSILLTSGDSMNGQLLVPSWYFCGVFIQAF